MSRRRTLAITALAALSIAAVSIVEMPTRLIWNATASTPIGFYTLAPADALDVPDLVAIMPPEPLTGFMVERGYVGRGVPLIKHVLGLPGQQVCRTGSTITIDGMAMGEALERDSSGRDLPVWQGCRVIAGDEIFLMNADIKGSLDGRYFGPIPASAVIGRALPLWTDEDGDGRFVWRALTH